jgi:hypothetical protein
VPAAGTFESVPQGPLDATNSAQHLPQVSSRHDWGSLLTAIETFRAPTKSWRLRLPGAGLESWSVQDRTATSLGLSSLASRDLGPLADSGTSEYSSHEGDVRLGRVPRVTKGAEMSKIIQSTTFRLVANHDEALEEVKRVKKFMEAKGVGVRAF